MRFAPRIVAWVLVLAGGTWFAQVSPHGPLEFFDDATREDGELAQLEPGDQTQQRRYRRMIALNQQLQRIALVHDLTSNRRHVDSEKYMIIFGGYSPDEGTAALLTESNEEYRRLASELGDLRAEIKANRLSTVSAAISEQTAGNHEDEDAARFTAELNRIMIRQFQAKIFWWEARR
jgi:hypothetical protein